MEHRKTKKFGGHHVSRTDLATQAINLVENRPEVKTISPGVIRMGEAGGMRKVKIAEIQGGLLLTCRQAGSVQEIRIFTENIHATRFALACALRDNDIAISFKH